MKLPNEKDKDWEIRGKNSELWDKFISAETPEERDKYHKEWRKHYDENIDVLGPEKLN